MTEENNRPPMLGDDFPEIRVTTTHGKISLPGDYKDKWFVLFSHPADFTPVCTTEFVGFQKRYEELRKHNCELIGLSIDQVFAHITWVRWIKEKLDIDIEFPVIAANERIAGKLGMIHPNKGAVTVRTVFVVDDKGKIRMMIHYPAEIGRNMDEVVRAVKALQLADSDTAVPAGWPENELIQDRLILPPPTTEEEAEARLKNDSIECYDWWFCHKPFTRNS